MKRDLSSFGRIAAVAAALAAAGPAALAYTRMTVDGRPLTRSPRVSFTVDPSVVAGLRNTAGGVIITPQSDPVSALTAAAATWSSVSSSSASLNVEVAPSAADPNDGRNVIVFEDSPAARSVVGSAIAVTVVMSSSAGRITDTDILFNPDLTFSTTPTANTFDLQSIATHEMGHTLGAGHSSLLSATMFFAADTESTFPRHLSADDVAMVSAAYPARGALLGTIRGKVALSSGAAASGAQVVAIDSGSGSVISIVPAPDGTYRMAGVGPGSYFVFAQPVAPWLTGDLGPSAYDTPDWQPSFYPSGTLPRAVTVTAGHVTHADITVADGPAQSSIDFGGVGGTSATAHVAMALPSNTPVGVEFLGMGFPAEINDGDIWILGPGISVRPGSIQVDDSAAPYSTLRMVLDVANHSDWTEAVIAVRDGTTFAVSSSFRIMPSGPAFSPRSVVDAASSLSGSIAPGEIVSILGSGLGPSPGLAGNMDESGKLPSSLGDVAVTFDGLPAPLFYVSSGQINAQVPFEVAGSAATRLQVRNHDSASEVILAVASASPSIFSGAVLNQDGSQQDQSHPAAIGSLITVYGNGQGVVTPPVSTGSAAPAAPLALVPNVSATIDGVPAAVEFAGMTPGLVGVAQYNIRIPAGTSGGAVPLVVSVDGVPSPAPAVVFLSGN